MKPPIQFIGAGAGSGKTTAVVKTIVAALLDGSCAPAGLIAGEAPILSETGATGPTSCWQDFLTMWGWRRQQLDGGLIEVSTVADGPDAMAGPPDLAPPLANWIPTKADAVGEYSPYGALVGWEEEQ